MTENLSSNVSIVLSKAAWLVLFDLIARSSSEWSKANPESYSPSAAPMLVSAEHPERVAFWWLENQIENTLPEIFSDKYSEILDKARQQLSGDAPEPRD
jgi:hypothetical protein